MRSRSCADERFVLVVICVALLADAYELDVDVDICESLNSLSNATTETTNFSCVVPRVCTDIDCFGSVQVNMYVTGLRYGLSFERVCLSNSSFDFYSDSDFGGVIRKSMNFGREYSFNISGPALESGINRDMEIFITAQIIYSKPNYFTISLMVLLKISPTKTVFLFPMHPISFPVCSKTNPPTAVTPWLEPTPPVNAGPRVDAGKECIAGEMGSCGDDQVCRELNSSSSRCFCLDGYELNQKGTCAIPPAGSSNRSVIWGVTGGLAVTLVLSGIFGFVVWRFHRRTKRYNDFDLMPQDVSTLDPPMIEA